MSITIIDEMLEKFGESYYEARGTTETCRLRAGLSAAIAAMAKNDAPVVIVHMTEIGGRPETYHVIGDARLFIVDESAPNDRVYEWLQRADPKVYRELIPEGAEIGNCEDGRHAAIKHRILSRIEGHPALSIVQRDDYE